ncbi:MAG TPA: hypothetical protein VM554_05020 [Acidisarcina sp.]|nr:hypothetical protein [Acidisarcina sp.]
MAKVTVVFGILLILLGVIGFVGTGSTHYTALIPCAFGVLLAIFGLLAKTPDASRRKLFMHIAVTVGLLGFLGTVKSVVNFFQMMQGQPFPYPAAVEAKAAMAALTFVYVVLCVRSFIAARRTGVV